MGVWRFSKMRKVYCVLVFCVLGVTLSHGDTNSYLPSFSTDKYDRANRIHYCTSETKAMFLRYWRVPSQCLKLLWFPHCSWVSDQTLQHKLWSWPAAPASAHTPGLPSCIFASLDLLHSLPLCTCWWLLLIHSARS